MHPSSTSASKALGSRAWPGTQGRAALRHTEAFLRRWLV
jgi:hypothetical protein